MMIFRVEFVTNVPEKMEAEVLYISLPFSIVMHLCACGCGQEVVTKLAPHRWCLKFDGETVSLYPSIGNWSLPCRSHYWITNNAVEWAASWSHERVVKKRKTLKKGFKWFWEGRF